MLEVDFEDAYDSAEQLVKDGIKLFFPVTIDGDFWVQWLTESEDPANIMLSETATVLTVSALGGKTDKYLTRHAALRDGTHAMVAASLEPSDMEDGDRYNQGMGWHRSKQSIGNYPVFGYLAKKTWILNEDLSLHLLNFQQVWSCMAWLLWRLCLHSQ